MQIDHELFLTGNPLIDRQHEQYLRLVDELLNLLEQEVVEQEVVDECLTGVLAYAVEHFDAEESLMVSSGYCGFESHRAKHDEFRDEADRLFAMSKEGIAPDDQIIHLTKWLLQWFLAQTLVHDKGLATFVKNRAQKSTNR